MSFRERLKVLGLTGQPAHVVMKVLPLTYDLRFYYLSHRVELLSIDADEIVGTQHASYSNRTWEKAFISLKRGCKNINYYLENPTHYKEAPRTSPHRITIIDVEGKGKFIDQGNNRLIIAKLLNLKGIIVDSCEFYKIDFPLKNAIEALENRGFEVEKERLTDNLIITLNLLEYKTTKNISELLSIIEQFDNLKCSRLRVLIYKLLSLINQDYKYKYLRIDRVKHWFHKNYLEFVKSKNQ